MRMTEAEAARFLREGSRGSMRLGLERIGHFLDALGGPHRKVPAVHIAGTNGKGSVTAYITAILASAGLRVGLFASPYVDRFGERIRVLDGPDDAAAWQSDPSRGEISASAATELLNRIRPVITEMDPTGTYRPTHFEMLTLMAFMHFADVGCDVMVLETGLGGRLDATNIIPAPVVTGITTIGYDHTEILGDTLAAIAGEKAGIIKRGTDVYMQDPALGGHDADEARAITDVVRARCEAEGVPLTVLDHRHVQRLSGDDRGQTFRLTGDPDPFRTALIPTYQPDNAALAVSCAGAYLRAVGRRDGCREALHRGVASAYLPARFEVLARDPVLIRDGGHNPQGAAALAEGLAALYPGRPLYLITAVMADKDYGHMLRRMLEDPALHVREIRCVAPDNPRALAPSALRSAIYAILDTYPDGETAPNPEVRDDLPIREALADVAATIRRRGDHGVIVAWGSLYQAGETAAAWRALTAGTDTVVDAPTHPMDQA